MDTQLEHARFAKILLLLNFLVSLHLFVGVYINSSFLETLIPIEQIGIIFTLGAFIAFFFLSQAEKFLIWFGEIKIVLVLLFLDMLGLLVLTAFSFFELHINSIAIIFSFLLHYVSAAYLIRFVLDVHYEEHMSNKQTGLLRGEILTTAHIAAIFSPLIFSQLLTNSDFWKIYALSFVIGLGILTILLLHFPKEKKQEYNNVFFFNTLKKVFNDKTLYRGFMISFIFHFSGSWIVIYLPIYLHKFIGFSWEQIGFLFTVMLIPYVLVDIPLGYIADRWIPEQKIVSIGFIIISLATLPIAFININSFLVWVIVLSLARFGFGTIQVMNDSYFFKHVSAFDGNLISFFRSAHPLAYIFGPLIASFLLATEIFEIQHLFIVLAFIMLSGLAYSLPLKKAGTY